MYSVTRRALAAVIGSLTIGAFSMHSQTPQVQPPARTQVGPESDGGFLLNTGWHIHPAGTTIPLSTLPMSLAPSPDEQRIAVLNGGYLPASVDYLDMKTVTRTSSVSITDAWRGLAFSGDGTKLYAGNGARAGITEFAVSGSQLTASKKIDLFPGEPRQTLHLIGDILALKNRLLVLDTLQDRLYEVDPVLGKITGDISVREISEKLIQHTPLPGGGTEDVDVEESLRRAACMSDEELQALDDFAQDAPGDFQSLRG